MSLCGRKECPLKGVRVRAVWAADCCCVFYVLSWAYVAPDSVSLFAAQHCFSCPAPRQPIINFCRTGQESHVFSPHTGKKKKNCSGGKRERERRSNSGGTGAKWQTNHWKSFRMCQNLYLSGPELTDCFSRLKACLPQHSGLLQLW